METPWLPRPAHPKIWGSQSPAPGLTPMNGDHLLNWHGMTQISLHIRRALSCTLSDSQLTSLVSGFYFVSSSRTEWHPCLIDLLCCLLLLLLLFSFPEVYLSTHLELHIVQEDCISFLITIKECNNYFAWVSFEVTLDHVLFYCFKS